MIDTNLDITITDIEYYKKELKKARYMIKNIYDDEEYYDDDDMHKEIILRSWVTREKMLERIIRTIDWESYDWNVNDKINGKYIYQRPHHNRRLEFSTFEESEFGFDEIYLRSEIFGIGNYNSDDDCMITDEGDKIKWEDIYRFRYVRD